jgi:hypothetical protein
MARSESNVTGRGWPWERTAKLLSMVENVGSVRKQGMLRIERSENEGVLFTLSGQLDDEPMAQLEELIDSETRDRRIALDLRNVTLVNEDAINFLVRCEANGITLLNCPAYVRDWIDAQRRDGRA